MKIDDNSFVKRCFDLAELGAGQVSPNPKVGAVIIHNNRIIGEGFHQHYGQAHAEVNAVRSVATKDQHLLSESTIYINLEPCCIHGNTPPCTDLIIKNKIPRIVFANIDTTAGVKGNSISILKKAGCEVLAGIEALKGEKIIAPRTTYTTRKRPYIILKYAQSSDGFIGIKNQQVWLTNNLSKRLVHKWRSEVDAILVGTNTAQVDNPQLTNRLYFGKSPLRIVLDRSGRLDLNLKLFDRSSPTWVFTEVPKQSSTNLNYISFSFDQDFLKKFMTYLHDQKIGSLLLEGGQKLLNDFIINGLWDEARVFHTNHLLGEGIKAPLIKQNIGQVYSIQNDRLEVFYNEL